jgi:hypothetical protein
VNPITDFVRPKSGFVNPINDFVNPKNSFMNPKNSFVGLKNDFVRPKNSFVSLKNDFWSSINENKTSIIKQMNAEGQNIYVDNALLKGNVISII